MEHDTSFVPIAQLLAPAFTRQSADTCYQVLPGWIRCLRKHTLRRVAGNAQPQAVPNHAQRHGPDTTYNFFERSAWSPLGLARRVGVLLVTRLKFGGVITVLVDDTLAPKRGRSGRTSA